MGLPPLLGTTLHRFVRRFYTAVHNGSASLHSQQQCRRVPFLPGPIQHLFLCRPFEENRFDLCEGILIVILFCIALKSRLLRHEVMWVFCCCCFVF